jgi:hypothetical protein
MPDSDCRRELGQRPDIYYRRFVKPRHDWPAAVPSIRPGGGRTFGFRCDYPRCGRHSEIRDDRLEAAVDRLIAVTPAGSRLVLDVSFVD